MALAAPVAEVVWLLPLPFLTVAAKSILLYFPPGGVGSMLFRPGITDKAFECFTVWQLAYASFVVQLLVRADAQLGWCSLPQLEGCAPFPPPPSSPP